MVHVYPSLMFVGKDRSSSKTVRNVCQTQTNILNLKKALKCIDILGPLGQLGSWAAGGTGKGGGVGWGCKNSYLLAQPIFELSLVKHG
jgi:hypothetical protein